MPLIGNRLASQLAAVCFVGCSASVTEEPVAPSIPIDALEAEHLQGECAQRCELGGRCNGSIRLPDSVQIDLAVAYSDGVSHRAPPLWFVVVDAETGDFIDLVEYPACTLVDTVELHDGIAGRLLRYGERKQYRVFTGVGGDDHSLLGGVWQVLDASQSSVAEAISLTDVASVSVEGEIVLKNIPDAVTTMGLFFVPSGYPFVPPRASLDAPGGRFGARLIPGTYDVLVALGERPSPFYRGDGCHYERNRELSDYALVARAVEIGADDGVLRIEADWAARQSVDRWPMPLSDAISNAGDAGPDSDAPDVGTFSIDVDMDRLPLPFTVWMHDPDGIAWPLASTRYMRRKYYDSLALDEAQVQRMTPITLSARAQPGIYPLSLQFEGSLARHDMGCIELLADRKSR